MTVQLWSREDFRPPFSKARQLDERWFKSFTGEWRVARALVGSDRTALLRFLNQHIRTYFAAGDPGAGVVKLAGTLVAKGFSVQRPISLASKLGFFYQPRRLIPYDRFAVEGLNRRRGMKRAGGEGRLPARDYSAYLSSFNRHFSDVAAQVKAECSSRWMKALTKRLEFHPNWAQSQAFQRKVFDNVLMLEGGRFS